MEASMRPIAAADDLLLSRGTLIHSKGSRTEFKPEAKTSEYEHDRGERTRLQRGGYAGTNCH